jgi:hypothetical protein
MSVKWMLLCFVSTSQHASEFLANSVLDGGRQRTVTLTESSSLTGNPVEAVGVMSGDTDATEGVSERYSGGGGDIILLDSS